MHEVLRWQNFQDLLPFGGVARASHPTHGGSSVQEQEKDQSLQKSVNTNLLCSTNTSQRWTVVTHIMQGLISQRRKSILHRTMTPAGILPFISNVKPSYLHSTFFSLQQLQQAEELRGTDALAQQALMKKQLILQMHF